MVASFFRRGNKRARRPSAALFSSRKQAELGSGRRRWYVHRRRPSRRRVRRRRRRRSAVSRWRRRCAARVWLGIARVARRARRRISGAGTLRDPLAAGGRARAPRARSPASVRRAARVLSGGRGAPTRPRRARPPTYFREVSVRGEARRVFPSPFASPPSRPTGPPTRKGPDPHLAFRSVPIIDPFTRPQPKQINETAISFLTARRMMRGVSRSRSTDAHQVQGAVLEVLVHAVRRRRQQGEQAQAVPAPGSVRRADQVNIS